MSGTTFSGELGRCVPRKYKEDYCSSMLVYVAGRSEWPCDRKSESVAARLMGLWVRILPGP